MGSVQDGVRWRVLANAEAVAAALRDEVLAAARAAIAARGGFALVLAGGSTPLACYRLLAEAPADWARWHVYYGDERCLPPADPGRNSLMARQAWLGRVPIPAGQVHDIPAELGPQEAARRYAPLVEQAAPFDLVLLGMGEDGHTASLFPGHAHPPGEWVHPVRDAPKPPPERVSLGLRALTATRGMLLAVTGSGKREAVAAWRAGRDLPARTVARAARALVLLDAEADATET